MCKEYFEYLYRDKAGSVRPTLPECHCTVCQTAPDYKDSRI